MCFRHLVDRFQQLAQDYLPFQLTEPASPGLVRLLLELEPHLDSLLSAAVEVLLAEVEVEVALVGVEVVGELACSVMEAGSEQLSVGVEEQREEGHWWPLAAVHLLFLNSSPWMKLLMMMGRMAARP
jgi:hypothetical protein